MVLYRAASSFDHLVGAGEKSRRNRQSKRLRSDQVDDQVEFDRLLDRQVRGLCAAQNLVDIVAGASEQVRDACPVGDQTSRVDLLASTMHRWQSCAQGQSVDPKAVAGEERVGLNIKRLCTVLERLDGGLNVTCLPDFECCDIEGEGACCRLNLAYLQHRVGNTDIGHERQPSHAGDNLAQEFEALGGDIGYLGRQAGDVAVWPRQRRD